MGFRANIPDEVSFRCVRPRAFTLVELLVAMTVLVLMVTLLFSIVNQASTIWQRSRNEVGSYQSVRFAFNLMTRSLAQSRMNAYQGYDNDDAPTKYIRKSDLEFVIDSPQGPPFFNQGNSVFFQAPLGQSDTASLSGLPGALNTIGYYVTYGKDPNLPAFLSTYDRNRFRLMQMLVPTEKMTVSAASSGSTDIHAWYKNYIPTGTSSAPYVNVVANNVILLLCWPRLSEQEDPAGSALTQIQSGAYRYDSSSNSTQSPQPITANQQPPLVQVTFVAIDDVAASRLPNTSDTPPQIKDALQGLFTNATVAQYKSDLATLESRLVNARIGYRIFNSNVALLEAKWTK